MLAAVRLNWRLWTIIQAELLSPDCPLPPDLRRNALSLANFVDKHTVAFIADPRPVKMGILIDINRELAAGLYQEPRETAEADNGDPGGGGTPSGGGQTPPPPVTGGGGITV